MRETALPASIGKAGLIPRTVNREAVSDDLIAARSQPIQKPPGSSATVAPAFPAPRHFKDQLPAKRAPDHVDPRQSFAIEIGFERSGKTGKTVAIAFRARTAMTRKIERPYLPLGGKGS